MKILQRSRWLLILSFMAVQVVSCSTNTRNPITPEQRLRDLGMDKEQYSSLPVCEQVRVYAGIAANYLDMGHFVAVVPAWMDSAIDQNTPATVADCISGEGTRQLDLLALQPDARHEISLTIHALVYKAYNLHILDYPSVQKFLHRAICENDIEDAYTLVLIDYVNQKGAVLENTNGKAEEQEMINELCGARQ